MIDLRPHLRAGCGVWWGQAAAEAIPLVDALFEQVADIGPVRAFTGVSANPRVRELPAPVELTSYGAMGELRGLTAEPGRLSILPAHYSALPRLFAERLLPVDVGLVQVSPPGPDGVCSFGIGCDYVPEAVPHTRVLIAEINARMPRTAGTPGIHLDRFAATIETDRPLTVVPERAPDHVDRAIAGHVAGLVRDGDTIQAGIGSLPSAILAGLAGHRDLGFHGGMITDAVLRLVDSGVLTGRYKEIDPGRIVTGLAVGSTEFYRRLSEPAFEFRPAGYTHGAAVLARLSRLVSINSALAVDLTGQVGAEVAGARYLGGIGGQGDFSGAAARTGALSIVALRSTSGEASAIVPALPEGLVTTGRADVDAVVTEHGVAMLRGVPMHERAARIAAVAAPAHRDRLTSPSLRAS